MVQIRLTTRRIELDDAVRASTVDKVGKLGRFVNGMELAEVRLSEERNPRIAANEVCEITLSGHGHHVRARASAATATAAVDICIEKLEHQLHKLKGRLDGRHHGGPKAGNHHAPSLGRAGSAVAVATATATLANAGPTAQAGAEAEENVARIVKTKQFVVSPLTPDDAALRMDLLQHDFFLFTNADTGRPAVIYRRSTGLIDSVPPA
jgi:putative sigma-54 modulation protein